MEAIRRPSQTSRPSSTLLGAQVDLSGEASPVPSWVVPSRAGAMTTTQHGSNSYTTGGDMPMMAMLPERVVEGASRAMISTNTQHGSNVYTFGGDAATALLTERIMEAPTNLGTVTTESHYIAGQHTHQQGGLVLEGGATVAGGAHLHGNVNLQTGGAHYTIANAAGGATTTTTTTTVAGGAAGTGELVSTGEWTTVTGEMRKDSRVVGREYGAQRLVSETRRVDESRQSVISERYVEHEIRIPKKIVREEVIEKVIVIPETVRHEEVIDDIKVVREKIVEVAKPTIIEKVVEIPEIEWVERIVEVPERVVQEKVVHKPVIHHQERVVEVPKVITREVPRVIPEISYRDVPVEKVVEKIEWVEKVVTRPVAVPQYVDKPVAQEVIVEKNVDVEVKIPVPVEAEVVHEYHLPQIKPRYTKATYPVYLPRFIEVPVATELLREDLKLKSTAFVGQIGALTQSAASLCEIENLAAQIMKSGDINSQTAVDIQSAVMKAWQSNSLQIRATHQEVHHSAVAATTLPAPVSQVETVNQTTYVSARSPLHADNVSKGASKKSKKSSKSNDKKN